VLLMSRSSFLSDDLASLQRLELRRRTRNTCYTALLRIIFRLPQVLTERNSLLRRLGTASYASTRTRSISFEPSRKAPKSMSKQTMSCERLIRMPTRRARRASGKFSCDMNKLECYRGHRVTVNRPRTLKYLYDTSVPGLNSTDAKPFPIA